MANQGTASVYRCVNQSQSYESTVTNGLTKLLNASSAHHQYFTGTSNMFVRLPATNLLVLGMAYRIVNLSSGTVTVRTSANSTITTVSTSQSLIFTCVSISANLPSSWQYLASSFDATLGGDVVGLASDNTIERINTQPINASNSSSRIMIGYTGTPPASSFTVGVGYQTFDALSDTAESNTAIGHQSLSSVTTGERNSAFGYQVLQNLTTADLNTAVGYQALQSNVTGNSTAFGYRALRNNTSGTNTACGYQAMLNHSTSDRTTAVGNHALEGTATVSISDTVAVGHEAMQNISGSANLNVAVGTSTLNGANPSAAVAIGYRALESSDGTNIVAIGSNALASSDILTATAVGVNAGSSLAAAAVPNTLIGGYSGAGEPVNGTNSDYIVLSDTVGAPKLVVAPFVTSIHNKPLVINSATRTQDLEDSHLVFTTTNCTLTLLAPSSNLGRVLHVSNISANSVVSASSNVVPMGSTTPGTAILTAVAGRYAVLQSDGTNWIVIMSN